MIDPREAGHIDGISGIADEGELVVIPLCMQILHVHDGVNKGSVFSAMLRDVRGATTAIF